MKKLGKVLGWAKEWWELFHTQEIASVDEARARVDIILLEDRIFYSASPLAMLDPSGEMGPEAISLDSVEALLQSAMALEGIEGDLSNGLTGELADISPSWVELGQESEQEVRRHEVAFVDASLEDVETMLSELRASQDSEVDWTIVYLDGTRDGILGIGDYLTSSSVDFDAVHLVTHGSADGLQLGSVWLDASTWSERRDALEIWQDGLVADADLLIYGCSVASTWEGQAWLGDLAAGLGVDLAASVDLTGHSSLTGNWVLEFQIGDVSTEVFASASVQHAWEGVLATYTVTSTNDSGVGTLRQAITDANANAGLDTIQFSVGTGVISIVLSTALPNITGSVVIDGWTQPGYSTTPIVVLDGGDLTGDGLVLTSTADGSTIRGLVIRDFNGDGIQIDSGSTGNTIVGNYLGSFATSGGNLGSGDANTGNGINVLGASNTIGGTTAALRNVIGGNLANGILLSGTGANNNIVQGNYIGTSSTGLVDIGNSGDGIRIASSAHTNTIGGATTAHGNIIVGNESDGIEVTGSNSSTNTISSNWIGVGSDGTTVIGNAGDGIRLNGGADDTTIGGSGTGNVIVANRSAGIEIDGTSSGTNIRGNFIGINASGTLVHGNALSGIIINNGASNTTLGGTAVGDGNTITDNGLMSTTNNAGVFVEGTSSGINIRGNSIYGNRGIGIDLGTNGITANDTLDGDTGSNNLQNYPTLSAASVDSAGTTVTVSGSINTNASVTGLLIHFYATPSTGNVSAREGRRYLGATTVSTNASGNATFSNITLSGYTGTVGAGELITATATTSGVYGSTSEFSLGAVATSTAGNVAPTTSQIVSTVDGGVSLNTTGFSSYLEAEDGSAILGGRSQLSMEFRFLANPVVGDGGYSLAAYANASEGDGLYLGAWRNSGSEYLTFMVNNSTITLATDIDLFLDGTEHSLAFTWTQASGAYGIYRDGVLIGSGTGMATGQTIASGGRFAVGVDLDAGADTWQPGGLFRGTFTDVRVFSDVRSEIEIASNFRSDLPYNEGNLIANWKFNDLSTENRTSNSVSENELVVRSFTSLWSSADTPGLALRLDENTTTGTIVGQVQGIDVEREAKISSLLAADSSLRYSRETGQFYKVVSSNGTWSAAQTGAMATTLNTVAGQLAMITSATENALVRSMLTGTSWLGGNDSLNEGEWRWYSGTSAANVFWQGTSTGYAAEGAYTNFVSGEPNDFGGNEDFLEIDINGVWNDSSSSATQGFYVVEWNADDVLDATNALTFSITTQTVTGAFSIDSDTGAIAVANGALLNFETQTSHTITVRTTDGSGATFDKNYTIALNNLTEENNAPSDLSSGVNLNTDGGNNAYLMTSSGGSVFGGRTALTLEVIYSMTSNASNENPLISYAVPGADNEVYLRVTPSGALSFAVNNVATVSTTTFAQLVDGQQHAVAVSWDNTAGDVRFYIDGQLVHTATGVKVGTTIQSGGTLVMGQDQDSVNGGYNATQRFSGTLYDVRVWDRAISDEQLALNYQQVPGATETGLVANWRMSGLSGGNTVVDSVGGVNLTVANVAVGGGFTASTPTVGLSVNENASVGTRVGQVLATDADLSRDIVADGLFREAANPGTFANYTNGQTIGNWTVQSGDVDLLGTSWQASPLGGRSIDLNGVNPGAVAQTLTTIAGRQYQVVFSASGNWGSGEPTKDFRVSAGGTSQNFSLSQPTGWSTTNMLFSGRAMTFTAIGSSSTLAFQSLDTGASGAVIADVRVIEIPAAVSAILSNDATLSYDAATGKFYRFVSTITQPLSAISAATSATLNGVSGQLATIRSAYENNLIQAFAQQVGGDVLLGGRDATTEGTWRFLSGATESEQFSTGSTAQTGYYTNWRGGEPNGSTGENQLAIRPDGQWQDVPDNQSRAYVIEWDASEVLSNFTYSISSDPSGAFAINSNTGEITVASAAAANEFATDPTITVQVTDAAGNTYSEAMTITVNRVNDNTPILTSNGGGTSTAINVVENVSTVTTVVASDADLPAPTLTYSIVGGADSAKFNINSSSGALTFASSPDFETPTDSGLNNVYDVVVRASDGTNFDDQSIAVTVTGVNEAPTDLYSVPNVTDANILGYYSFSSANNLGRDDAGDSHPVTFVGSPTQTTRSGGSSAVDLSGGQYGNIASMTTGGAMTIAGWVKFDSTGNWERVVDLGQTNAGGIGNILIGRYSNTDALNFTIEKQGSYVYRLNAAATITNGVWMHVAATVDSSGLMSLYVNGSLAGTANGVAPDVGVRTNQFIGKSNWAADSAFDGAIDDLLITSGAMSATSIANLYQQSNGFTLAENTANGTLLGTVYATDPDAANTYTYSLVDDASGAFTINSSNGQLSVNNSSQLNFEGDSTLSVVVRATDQGGLSYNETIAINLTGVNEFPTFSSGSGRNYTVISGMQFGNAIAQQTDGKYVMAGWSDSGGTRDFAVVRYNFDGSLDTTFGSGNGYVITTVGAGNDEAQDVRVLSSGKILVQGYAINGGNNDIAFVQYNSDGSLDTSFGGGTGKTMSGIAGEDTGYSMAIQTDGKIVVGGVAGNDFLVARFNSDGSLDTSFGSSGSVTTDFASNSDTGQAIALQSDGKIVLAGRAYNSTTYTDYAIARYNTDGSLDTSFNSTGKVMVDFGSSTDQGYGLAIQSDGAILVNGFTNAAGGTDNGVIRLTSSGALDTTFNSTGRVITSIGSGSDFGFDLKVQSDGKILSSGYASVAGNDFTLIRYNANGSLDTTFGGTGIVVTNFNATTDDRGAKIFLQADGTIVMAGCTTQGGTYDFALARYNPDGSADVTFNASNTLGGSVSYTENGSAIVMDSNVSIFDAELTASNFSGSTLTLTRNGGANSQDLFLASGTLSTLTQGGNLVVGGTTIGTVTTNSNGTLILTFNSSATRTLVESAMRQIAYSNSGDAPPSSVQVNWTFNDGNTGAQGTGGALTVDGSVTVNITAVNDAPVLTAVSPNLTAITETSNAAPSGVVGTLVTSLLDMATPSGGRDNVTDADGTSTLGIAVTSVESNYGTWWYSINGGTNWSLMGNVSSTASLLLTADANTRVYFQINTATEYWGSMGNALNYRAWDQSTGSAGTYVSTVTNGGTSAFSSTIDSANLSVSAVNDAPRLLGGELIANGTLNTNISGWTTTGTVALGSNALAFGSSNAVGPHTASQTITTVAGQTYELSFQYKDDSGVRNQSMVVTANGSGNLLTTPQIVTSVSGTSYVTYYYTFVADSSSTSITFTDTSDTSGLTTNGTISVDSFVDNISVRQRDGNFGTLAYTENSGTQAVYASLSLNDFDSSNMTGASVQITSGYASAQDILSFTNQNGITGSWNSTNGTLTLSGTTTRANYELALQSVTYTNSSDAPTASRTVTFLVNDGTTNNIAATRDISIANVNDAPILTPYGPTLPLTEDGLAYTATISSLVGSSISDLDSGAVNGVALTNLSLAGGTLEYSLDGTNWITVSGVSATNALLLRSTDQMRFTPSTTNGGTTNIAYNAWDQTSGAAGGFANVTTTGGSTAFSLASDTITVNVASVNDAPVLDTSGTMTLTTITEDQTNNSGQTVASIIASAGGDRITDVDSSAIEGIAITSLSSGNGIWQFTTNGFLWADVGAVSESSALLLRSTDLIRFNPDGQNATSASFDFRAWDQTSGSVGSKVDVATYGGTTAFSSAIETAAINVTSVNDGIGTLSDANATINTVAENAAISTVVGITALAIDVDAGATVTYSLDYDAGGRYAIDSITGVVTVAGALNAENQFYETILVRAISSDGSAVVQGFDITVTSVNEAPHDIRVPVFVASENFESGATGWSNTQTVNGGGTLTNYLGGFGSEIGTTEVYKDFALSGNQSSVTITFDFYELDSWDGEAFKVWVDGVEYSSNLFYMDFYGGFYSGREVEPAISQQMTNGGTDLNTNGFDDEIHRYSFTINTTGSTVRLGFSSNLNDIGVNEGWGVDNLHIVENRPALLVAENSANTTVVGTVQGYDVDAGATISYSLTDNAGGRFAISASTGAITVANGSLLNFESLSSHTVIVRTTDQGGMTFDSTVTINLTDVNEAPIAVFDTTIAVEAGGTSNGTSGTNSTGNVLTNDTDVDAGDSKTVSGVAAGVVGSASTNVGSNVTGTYGSINIAADGTYTYTVDNSNATVQAMRTSGLTLSDVFTYTMRDSGSLASTTQLTVTIQGSNDAPIGVVAATYLSTLTPSASNNTHSGVLNDVDHTTNSLVLDTVAFPRGIGMHAPTSGVSTVDYELDGATVFKATIGINDYTTGNFGTVIFRVYVDSVLQYTSSTLTSTSAPVDLSINTSGGTTLRLEVDGAGNGNSSDHAVWFNARLEGGAIGLTIAENSANGSVVGSVNRIDADWGDIASYTLMDDAGGRFAINTATGLVTVADSSLLDFETTTSHTVVIRATDAGGLSFDQTMTISVTGVNEAPVLDMDDGIFDYDENASHVRIGSGALITDADAGDFAGGVLTATLSANGTADDRLFLVSQGSGPGQVQVVGNQSFIDGLLVATTSGGNGAGDPLVVTFTANADVAAVQAVANRLSFQNVSESPSPLQRTVQLVVTDGDGGTSNTDSVLIDVHPINDAPVLDDSGTMTLTTITEDETNNAGNTVADIILSAGGNRITDVDSSAVEGIAITNLNTGYGKWQYSIDGGGSWLDVGTVSSSSALLLRSTDSIRFLPQFENGSNPDFTFRAWDQSSGMEGTKVDTSSHGGSTAFSSNTETASIVVTDVNDAPVLDSARTPVFTAINEDAGMVQSIATLIDAQLPSGQVDNVADDDIGAQFGIAITGVNASNGTWSYSIDNGATWLALGAVSDSNARLLTAESTTLLNFAPNANFHGAISDAITFRAWDRTSGSNGGLADASVHGGTTAFSSDTDVVGLTVNAVNDNPNAVADADTAVEAGGTANGTAGANPSGNVLTNDTDVDSGDTKTVTGVASGSVGSASGNVGASVSGLYGAITMGGDGSYSYTVDNSNATVQALRTSANTLDDVFTYTMLDTAGLASTTQVTITIQGSNDRPHDISGGALAVDENAIDGTSVGSVSGQDVDAGETFTYTLVDSAGGRFAIDNAGQVTVANGTLLNREAGASHTITVRVADAAGASYDKAFVISVQDVNEFSVTTPVDSDATGNLVAEDATVGTSVGVTALASDADATTNTISYSLDDDASGLFAIDASTGEVTVLGTLDYETAVMHTITVRASSADGSFETEDFSIQIGDVNEGSVGTISDSDVTTNFTMENTPAWTSVGIIATATDPDGSDTVTYSLDDDAGGRFSIHVNTGVVFVIGTLNREVAASYGIVVRATSSDTSFSTQNFTIAIGDEDEFNVSTPTDSNAIANGVDENATIGTVVGLTANAFDLDATTNAITYSLTSNPDGLFQIDASTGVVTTAITINRELHGATRNLTVQAQSSDGSTATQSFSITINDVNEFSVGAVSDIDGATNAIAENATVGTLVGITVTASDADATNHSVTYSLQDDDGGRFAIDANSGVVSLAGSIDRETDGATRSITIRATSADGSFTDQAFTVNINDVDEFDTSAISDTNGVVNSVMENASNGTVVGVTAFASDGDATTNVITYSLDDDAGGRFAIHASTGVVTVVDGSLLDFETQTSHVITIRATSADTSSTTANMTIGVTDANEGGVGAVSDSDGGSNHVAENATVGTVVGITGHAVDPDGTDTVTFSLDDDAGGRFAIHASTGVVMVAGGINREAAGSYDITIRATSSDTSSTTQTFTIQVDDVDEFDVIPIVDSNAAANSVVENASVGTVVGVTAFASDADATTNAITFTLVDDDGGRFAIHGTTGVVTVAGAIDREADGASRDITVRATSADGSYQELVMSIAVVDANESSATTPSDSNGSANAIDENVSVGTVVGITASSLDADATNHTITYSLTSNPNGLFQIDANTGVVTTAAAIDRELHGASRSITVRATSSDTSYAEQTFAIVINDLDEFDTTAISDTNGAANSVVENASNGTVVGVTAFASDGDATTSTITYSLDDNAGGRFAIDASTGVVTVADGSLLNYEAQTSHMITVRATSADTSSTTANYTIVLTDANEGGVGAVSDSDGGSNHVAENATVGTVVGITGHAVDPDGTDTVTFSLDDDAGGRFAIHASTGVVTVAGGINREAAGSYDITIRATSSDTSSTTQTFTIQLDDVDEFDVIPIVDSNATANSVVENASVGTVVGITAFASDADATTNTITYTLVDDDGGRFAIHGTTGVVTVAGAIDREADGASRDITVRATSADGSYQELVMSIAVVDANESSATTPSDSNGSANAIDENVSVGTVVGITASSLDADATNHAITYSLTSNPNGLFQIDANTGVVTTAAAIDRELHGASRSITVRATSSDTSYAEQTFAIGINDLDEFDTIAISDTNGAANSVVENASNGTVVGVTAFASDGDATTSTITYSLDDDAGGRFAIHASTGVVTVAGGINREAAGSYDITIRATSSDTSSTTQTFTIQVDDVDEFDVIPIVDSNATVNSVVENASVGTVVGITAFASDADATTNAITYTLVDDDGGRFAIHATTGVVTVAGAIDRETDGASRDITVRATSADGSYQELVMSIAIVDANEASVSAPIDNDGVSNSIQENAIVGTATGIMASSTDSDATNHTIVYSLTSNPNGLFQIDAITGVVTTAMAIDREVHGTNRSITVRATSSDGSYAEQVFSIAVQDVDEFDTSAISDINGAANLVVENAVDGTAIGVMAFASDGDATTNTITYSLDDDAGGRFAIDSLSGMVSVANGSLLDFEDMASHAITIRATSADTSYSVVNVTIGVVDANEESVGVVSDTDSGINRVVENASIGSLVGITGYGVDPDGTATVTYSLDADGGGRFAIDAITGVVTVAGGIDREEFASYVLRVRATSNDASSSVRDFVVEVDDVDEFDVGTLTDIDNQANSIGENASDGSYVGMVAFGSDADATQNSITYTLVDDANGRFVIDGNTGLVRVANGRLLDFEAEAGHQIRVRAESSDGSLTEQWFSVSIEDRQEAPRGVSVQYTTTFIDDVIVGNPGLLENASDPDGDGLSVFVVSGPARGVLTWQGDGSFVYEPVSGITGIETIVYRVFDGVDSSSDLTVTIVVVMPTVQAPVSSSGGGIPSTTPTDNSADSSNVNTSAERDVKAASEASGQPIFSGVGGVVEGKQEGARSQDVVFVSSAATSTLVPAVAAEALKPLGVTEIAVGIEGMFRLTSQSLEGSLEERNWSEQGKSGRYLWESSSENGLTIEGSDRRDMEGTVDSFGNLDQLVMQTVIGTGAVIWVVQGLQLLATLLSVTPAWLHMDPLNIVSNPLQKGEEEQGASSAEEQLFDQRRSRSE